MKFTIRTLLGLCALAYGIVHASVITETWWGQVAQVDHTTAYSLGETVTWNVIYDEASIGVAHFYADGALGRADRGMNDDTVAFLHCLESTLDPLCGTIDLAADGFTAIYDSTTQLDTIYQRMLAGLRPGDRSYDYWDTNTDNRTFRNVPWGVVEQLDYWADDFRFAADTYPFRCVSDCPNTGDASFFLTYLDSANELQFASVSLTRLGKTTSRSTVVPEPGMITLFLIALISIWIVRRSHKVWRT